MSIDKVLAEQDDWLKKTARAVAEPDKFAGAVGMPLEIRNKRTEELKARIEALEAQKQAAAKRYDAAIAAEKAEIELLARDVAWEADGPRSPRDQKRTTAKATSKAASRSGRAAKRKGG